MTEPRHAYVVDEQGATWCFERQSDAERHLIAEAWRGAVHLTIGKIEVPGDLEGDALVDYCVAHAPDAGCDN